MTMTMSIPEERAEDATLLAAVRSGSEAALEALYDRYASSVHRIAMTVTQDRGAAEDVVQETFLAAWNRAELYDPRLGTLGSWLHAIARNRSLDHLRRTSRRALAAPFSSVVADRPDEAATIDWLASSGALVAAAAAEPTPDVSVETAEARRSVREAMAVLTEHEREAILLAYRDGLSQSEIAQRLGWPLGTVKTRSRRALRRLREALGESVADPEETVEIVAASPPATASASVASARLLCCA